MKRDTSKRTTSNGQMDYDRPGRLGGVLWGLVGVVGLLLLLVGALIAFRQLKG